MPPGGFKCTIPNREGFNVRSPQAIGEHIPQDHPGVWMGSSKSRRRRLHTDSLGRLAKQANRRPASPAAPELLNRQVPSVCSLRSVTGSTSTPADVVQAGTLVGAPGFLVYRLSGFLVCGCVAVRKCGAKDFSRDCSTCGRKEVKFWLKRTSTEAMFPCITNMVRRRSTLSKRRLCYRLRSMRKK